MTKSERPAGHQDLSQDLIRVSWLSAQESPHYTDCPDNLFCRVSRLVFAAAAAGRSALGQHPSGSHVPAAGMSVVWEQMAACLSTKQHTAQIHTSRHSCRAEPAEELQEDHRAALRSVTPKVLTACRVAPSLPPCQMPDMSPQSMPIYVVCLWIAGGVQMYLKVPSCTPRHPRPCVVVSHVL